MAAVASILNSLKNGDELPMNVVNYMYENGGFLLFLNFPEGSEFGIDYKSWKTGEKFKGLKMIPPGVHFVYCSIRGMPRIGFFHTFKSGDILVKKWDRQKEDFCDEVVTEDDIKEKRNQLKSLDSNLAPYPYENYRSWYALTDFVTPTTVERVQPLKGRITAQAELVSLETKVMENKELRIEGAGSNRVDRDHPVRTRFVDQNGLPIMQIREGYEIRFQDIPQLRADMARIGIEHSDRLNSLLRQFGEDWKQLLAELQIAFVCFLIGQVFEGFEQWKRLIHLLCCCPNSLGARSEMFLAFVRVLFFQLKECPSDFFVDIVSRDNFLTTTLSMFFANVRDSAHAPENLKRKSAQFKAYLTRQFKWDFECND
ncbi:unnamed protein product [Caenorhabditis auriculariae]|uniref:Protein AAR2 homolog n=1 Tax=Caenorhabditis auriculariae TaxID=2777116 RepID=A0A8S1HEQ5_9PELO|nr:unnamed protein product [Caenorhabditis auriculariae]